jgi:hypothetical protein
MEQLQKNKEFIINYFNALSGVAKTKALIERFVSDETLIAHIHFFEAAFPKYEMYAEEVVAEGNLVVVKARFKGTHMGDLSGMAPTYKAVDIPFVIRYEVKNNLITSHWLLADQTSLLEQLGVMPAQEAAH